MDKLKVFNIQRYSIHDGHGIRTTVFFKGCPLKCTWCHNPEGQRIESELLFDADKCAKCGRCIEKCPNKSPFDRGSCILCGTCVDICPNEAREIAGRDYSLSEIVAICRRDIQFYEQSGGGVTLSGGEVMLQPIDALEELMRRLTDEGISVNIDTCGQAPWDKYERILKYTDVFLYDIKAMDTEVHREYTGVGNELILENLKRLAAAGARISIRMPLVENVNSSCEDIQKCARFLKNECIRPVSVHLLPYHDTGMGKYRKMGIVYGGSHMRAPDNMEELRKIFIENGFGNVKIGG